MLDLNDILASANGPTAKVIKINGEDVRVYVRNITAGEQQQLLAGQKVSGGTNGALVEIDLSQNEGAKHKMVAFAICDADGKRRFANDREVAKLPAQLVNQLFQAAKEVNDPADPEALGNS